MSTAAIVTAAQAVLVTAVPTANVMLGIPKSWNDDVLIYLWHDGYTDTRKTTGGNIQRTHVIPIHLLVATAADDSGAELAMMTLTDDIAAAFYTHHRLSGAAANCELKQRDGAHVTGLQYILQGQAEYRNRWWTLTAVEYIVYAEA